MGGNVSLRDTLISSMCERCDQLRAAYRADVEALNEAVRNIRGAFGEDFNELSAELQRLRKLCDVAAKALNEHWYETHDPRKTAS